MLSKKFHLGVLVTYKALYTRSMKVLISFCVFVFGIAFAYIPYLWGDTNFFSLWSILLSMVGAFFGIYVGYKLGRRWL